MTAMLTAADTAALRDLFVEAQEDHALVLARSDGAGGYTTITAQDVQVAYAARQPQSGVLTGTAQTLSGLTFYRESPFNVQVGDLFELDGHKGGTIRRVYPDPVLGVIAAEADLDTGR
jgi:hypothetical protein